MLSILYPSDYENHISPERRTVQQAAFRTFGCERIVGKKIAEYFTDDPVVLHVRNELFAALIRFPGLCSELSAIGKHLSAFYETLDYMKKIGVTAESNLRSILTAQSYVRFVHALSDTLERVKNEVSVPSLDRLYEVVQTDLHSEDFERFESELVQFDDVINNIQSITVGVNLDAQLRPKEAGLISINNQSFKSGNIIDRFLRLEFKKDEYCCIAPLTSATREMAYTERFQVDNAVNQAFEKVLKHTASYSVKHTVRIIEQRMQQYAGLMEEFAAIAPVLQYITRTVEAGLPLCVASPADSDTFLALDDFYDARLFEKEKRIVLNKLTLEDRDRVMILTGPNSGGKTVVMRAIAIIELFASLGIPLPAQKAAISGIPLGIFAAFSPDNGLIDKGRLEQECAALGEIYEACGNPGMVFLDEPFSTTSYGDAIELLHEFVGKMIRKEGVRLVITTHFHAFAKEMQDSGYTVCCSLGSGSEAYVLKENSISDASRAKNISEKYW